MAQFTAKSAKRELIWTKLALLGPSGSGKSFSSLRIAKGMLEALEKKGLAQNGRILFMNTEQKRGYYYANEFAYDIVDIDSPHNPEKYIEFLEWAVEEDYPIVIMDSTSHEWEGTGGCLELHQRAGGTFQSWGKITPRHNKFISAIADSEIHIVATMRGKDQYEIEKGDKISVKKVGKGAKQREGFEYEFTATFMLDQKTNTSETQKDNTHIFENLGAFQFTEKHGKQVIEWANSGKGYTPPVRTGKSEAEVMSELKTVIVDQCKELGGSDNKDLIKLLKKYNAKGNPNSIKSLEKLKELDGELKAMQKNKAKDKVKDA